MLTYPKEIFWRNEPNMIRQKKGKFHFALKDSSSFDLPRYDCVLFMSLIKLNGECFAAKNVHLLSLVKVNSENFALTDSSSFDLPRYDCVLFMSLIKLNGKWFAVKMYNSCHLSRWTVKIWLWKVSHILTHQDMIAYFLCH